MENEKQRYIYIDFLKVVSFFFIVLLHTSALLCANIQNDHWDGVVLCNALTRFAVPIFILCSGAMLLRHPVNNIKSFLSRRFFRIVLPFLFWSVMYEIHKTVYGGGSRSILDFIHDLFFQNVCYHLWFVYMILAMYLLVPILHDVMVKQDEVKLQYGIGLWLFFSGVVSFEYFMQQGNSRIFYFPEFMGYFMAGWLIHNKRILLPRCKGWVIFLIATLITGVLAGLVIHYSHLSGQYYENFFEPYFLPIAGGSLFIFQYFRDKEKFFRKHAGFANVISRMSGLTYGGYLVHILVLEYVRELTLMSSGDLYVAHNLIGVAICTITTYIVSLLIIACFHCIPYLQRLV